MTIGPPPSLNIAEVADGVWLGQEPGRDSPINRGSHCCKGAAVRDDVLSNGIATGSGSTGAGDHAVRDDPKPE